MRLSRGGFTLVSVAAVLIACDNSIAPEKYLPSKGVEIVVDSAVYHLQPRQTRFYQVNLTATVINGTDHDVYVWQDCGYWSLRRADGNGSRLELGAYDCADGSTTRPAPRAIAAGERYTETFQLMGSLQPQARPQITLEDNIGKVQFVYMFTNPLSTELVPVRSEPFTVLPPA